MEGLVDFGVILFAAVVHATLQLGVGTLLLLYHESLGRKVKKVTKRLATAYLLGVAIFTFTLLSTVTLAILISKKGPLPTAGLITLSGLLMLVGLLAICFYYQRGKNTMLWIPNSLAKYLEKRAGKAETPAEGLALGLTTALGELPFALVLLVAAGNSLLRLPRAFIFPALAIYVLITVLPLIIMKLAIKKGQTVAEVQRWRVAHKTFLKIFTALCYLVLALFLIAFKILGRS